MATAPEFPVLPGIDTQAGLKRLMNKVALYEKVLRDFHTRFRDESSAIHEAIAVGELATAGRRAHSLKGLAGAIGASPLQQIAGELEQAVMGGYPNPSLTTLLDDELRKVLDGIAACLSIPPAP